MRDRWHRYVGTKRNDNVPVKCGRCGDATTKPQDHGYRWKRNSGGMGQQPMFRVLCGGCWAALPPVAQPELRARRREERELQPDGDHQREKTGVAVVVDLSDYQAIARQGFV